MKIVTSVFIAEVCKTIKMLVEVLISSLVHLCLAKDDTPELETVRSSIHHYVPKGRIIGGKVVNPPHSVKYMAFIETHDINDVSAKFACGGTLISSRHILTAAHCLEGVEVEYVLLGAHDVSIEEPEQLIVYPENWIVHDKYYVQPHKNDLGIIKLTKNVDIKSHRSINIVKLEKASDASKLYVRKSTKAYGWGWIRDKPRPVEVDLLHEVSVYIISNRVCLRLAPEKDIYDGDICTSGTNVVGTCNGDSGGPLMLNNKQIGVTSRGVTVACEESEPSVYVRVAKYRDWIDQQIKDL